MAMGCGSFAVAELDVTTHPAQKATMPAITYSSARRRKSYRPAKLGSRFFASRKQASGDNPKRTKTMMVRNTGKWNTPMWLPLVRVKMKTAEPKIVENDVASLQ